MRGGRGRPRESARGAHRWARGSLDILKDQWSPALTIKTALLSVQALLTAGERGVVRGGGGHAR